MENYRKILIRTNRVKKISSEHDAVIRRATSGSRAVGSRPCSMDSASLLVSIKKSFGFEYFVGDVAKGVGSLKWPIFIEP